MVNIVNITNDPKTGYNRKAYVEPIVHWEKDSKYLMAIIVRFFDGSTELLGIFKQMVHECPDYAAVVALLATKTEAEVIAQLIGDMDTANLFD